MPARLIFVHGTTVRDVSSSMAEIRKRSSKILGLGDSDVVAAEWGREVGPPPLDIRLALPPEYSTRDAVDDQSSRDPSEGELWELLMADPSIELRLLAVERSSGEDAFSVAGQPPSDAITEKLREYSPPTEQLATAGFSQEEFDDARKAVLDDPAAVEAIATATEPTISELVNALAHSLVARMLRKAGTAGPGLDDDDTGAELPPAAVDAAVRTALVDAVIEDLGASTRGVGDLLKKVGGSLATRVAVSKRTDFMGPMTHFLHDVTFYIAHGADIREVITRHITAAPGDGPIVVLAHSLGGIAAVDLLSDQAAPRVDLLVTVGTQASLLYLMDSLQLLRPSEQQKYRPKVPWLNIYNREDLLSFCAEKVFPGVPGIKDHAVDAKVPFPASHSAYWAVDDVYRQINQAINELATSTTDGRDE